MASSVLRLRRVVSLSSAILRSITTIPHRNPNPIPNTTAISQLRHFRSSAPSLYSARDSFRNSNNYGNLDDEIGPDTILFEGCDYNHWLITMEFPKDPAPTRDEMIETYLQTLAKVVGSYEEAKKKMYACSTTTYVGFQCLVSEEESEKFKNLPGVVFVLPDSYIDPVNKEYGGDKYDNGVITLRPPPMQYGRQGGRYGDRNRDFNRNPRQMQNEQGSGGYDNQRPRYEDNRNFNQQQNHSMPNQQGNQGYDNQRPRFGDNRNFGPQPNTQVPNHQPSPPYANQGQNPPVQPNYGPTAGVERRNPLPNNYHQVPNQQPSSGYANQGPTYGVNRQEQHPHMQPNYGSTVRGERTGPLPTNASPWGRDAMPPFQGSSNNYQNQQGFHNPQGERMPEQRGYIGDRRNYASPQGGAAQGHGAEGNYGQTGGGNFGQTQEGSFVKGVNVRDHPPSFNYQNDYTAEDEAKNSKDKQTQESNYVQMGQTGNQGRY